MHIGKILIIDERELNNGALQALENSCSNIYSKIEASDSILFYFEDLKKTQEELKAEEEPDAIILDEMMKDIRKFVKPLKIDEIDLCDLKILITL